jgi:chondroitin 4-sulfotransferase 11
MNFIFIHVPKCAGTSMEQMKWIERGGHATYQTVIKEAKDKINKDTFSFSFVRNPYCRLYSTFTAARTNLVAWPKVPECYNEYVKWIYTEGKYVLPHERTSTLFLMDLEGNIGVDFVGRFENLQEDWKYVCEKINAPKEDHTLPWKNKNDHLDWQRVTSRESIRMINQMYHIDFLNFGYEKLGRLRDR